MLLYNEKEEKVRFRTSEDNFIGRGQYGSVYRTSALTCAKVYRGQNTKEIDPEVLKKIRELSLRNFYEIYDLLYTKKGTFKGYIMQYYNSFDIDILTMPTDYTLDNLYILRDSILKLTNSSIWAFDMHEDNVILGENSIIVIDTDLYSFNKFYSESKLMVKNIKAVNNLFFHLYIEAMKKYHNEYDKYTISQIVSELFSGISEKDTYHVTKRLTKHKYPIDYLKACNKK